MCFSGGRGGMDFDAFKLAGLLSDLADVVLVSKKGTYIERRCEQQTLSFSTESIRFSSRTFSPVMLVEARRIVRQYNVKNVVFFGASELKTLYFAFLGLGVNVIVRHGTTKSRPKRDWLHKLVYSCVNHHVALSKHLLRNVQTIVPLENGVRFHIIYPSYRFNGDTGRDRGGSGDSPIEIIHVGRIAEGKGQLEAVQAVKRLVEQNVRFRLALVGSIDDGKYHKRLREEIDRSGYQDDVAVVGHVDNVEAHLRRADVFLFPSHGEGMPNAFIEALYCGCVCIAFRNTVFPEFPDMGFYVRLSDDRDIAQLSDVLCHVARHIADELRRSQGNVELVRKYFNAEREWADWSKILV